ncbi:MAG TPA: hypothetical protein DDW34_13810, partial [Clostridium sp.]|nr:hypothetical protein [Clostridium sp.]
MLNQKDEFINKTNLWLSLKLESQLYAIDSSYVESISVLEEPVSVLPDSNIIKRGIIHSRGNVVPIIDLRPALGLKT